MNRIKAIATLSLVLLFRSSAEGDAGFFEKTFAPLHRTLPEVPWRRKQEGGLRLDSAEGLLDGGENGPVIVPGSSEKSRLFQPLPCAWATRNAPHAARNYRFTDIHGEAIKDLLA